jgi:aspartyl-tRNA(Asn)/glutamyl-tRNA(Gln) amidotransferase subunit B
MEVVSEPDIRSPEEGRQYLIKLRSILRYLGVSTGNMEEGSFRCDANLSIRPVNSQNGFAKVEVKNMNSFKAVFRALEYEAERQREVAEKGGHLVQETRGWVEEKGITVSQRSKEYAHDYRYFPEPDLPPLMLDRAWVEEIKAKLPELPETRRDRLIEQYKLPLYDANIITSSKALADYFEACLSELKSSSLEKRAKNVSNWLLGDFARLLNLNDMEIDQSKIEPVHLTELLDLIDQDTISGPAAKTVFEEMFDTGNRPGDIVAQKGLTQISDTSAIEEAAKQAIAANSQAVADYKAGKEQALKFLVGQVMKATKGRANPQMVNDILKKEIDGGGD